MPLQKQKRLSMPPPSTRRNEFKSFWSQKPRQETPALSLDIKGQKTISPSSPKVTSRPPEVLELELELFKRNSDRSQGVVT